MPIQIDYETLQNLSNGGGLNQIQNIFNTILFEIINYLNLNPLYKNVVIRFFFREKYINKTGILDLGVERILHNSNLEIEIYGNYLLLPFILIREAYYCFIPKDASDLIKICINQIIENDLNKLSSSKNWNKIMRDHLVDSDFFQTQFDKLRKFFKIEAKEPLESTIEFFFKDIRENAFLIETDNIKHFYDLIFERYSYKNSRSLFNEEIIETLRVFTIIFYKTKSYLNLYDYYSLFKEYKGNRLIESWISIRKFKENMQWINRCSPSIAPSYDIFYNNIDLYPIICFIKFNPLLEKYKVKKLIDIWPFYHSPKFSENSFAVDLSLVFIIPKIYLDDFLAYLNSLESNGYIIGKELCLNLKKNTFLNLNYFCDLSNIKKIIDPNSQRYKKEYEIEHEIEYSLINTPPKLSVFDFKILDRIRYVSVVGLTFDKRSETLNALKEDVENEVRKQITINTDFKESIDELSHNLELKQVFLKFLDHNQKLGFFYLIDKLNKISDYLDYIKEVLENNPKIKNEASLRNFLNSKNFSGTIEENLLIQDEELKKVIFNDFVSYFFQNKDNFLREIEKVQLFYKILKSFNEIRIFRIDDIKKIIKNKSSKGTSLAEKIHKTREDSLNTLFNSISPYKITNEKIELTIEKFLNYDPPIIKPWLINTVITSTFAKYYPIIILKDTSEARMSLKILKKYFPRTFIYEVSDLINKRKRIVLELYLVDIKEKDLFIEVLNNFFDNAILTTKRYFWRGVARITKYQAKDFYDFQNGEFFYVKDFFKHLKLYSERILGEKLKGPRDKLNNNTQVNFWSNKIRIDNLISIIKKRVYDQNINFDLSELNNLLEFQKEMETTLLTDSKFLNFKSKKFFKTYISSIKFIPAFQKFKFSQYLLYFRPLSYNEIDFKLLFLNSFQTIKSPASFDKNQPLFIKNIFPFRTPNKSYLNWIIKSKKNISEYCLFFKKKFYDIIHFNRNLTKEGWNYSSIRFKSYTQNVLFNPFYDIKIPNIREFDLEYLYNSNFFEPEQGEYYDLSQIYSRRSVDIKSYLATKKYNTINKIKELLQKKLVFPYLSLKNLDFQNRVSIILPNVEKKFNEKLIKIFSFFNVCHIFEIEGEVFIYGFEDVKSFENGLFIEIWFPKCELDEFFEVFDLIFEYFKIKHYLILTDLVDGKHLLKSVYGDLKFLDEYNPIKNLIWNDKDKIWMNHKLFNEKFEPLYPDLLYGNKKEEF
jgi:hypothetical protein